MQKKLFTKHFVLGLLVVPMIAYLAFALSVQIGQLLGFEKSPLSPVILAIFIGLILGNTIGISDRANAAIMIYSNYILKLGVIFLGIGISFTEILNYGKLALPLAVILIAVVLVLAKFIGKFLGLPHKLTALIAVGTSICGATAIVATTPLINAKKEESSYAVAVIAIFGSIAMLCYPYLSYILFDANVLKAGLFLGSAIHDTAQVAGAALIYSQQFDNAQVLDIATTTKLVRNSLMILVIPLIIVMYNKTEQGQNKLNYQKVVPLFVIGFLLMVTLRSIGDFNLEQGAKAFGMLSLEAYQQVIQYLQFSALICLITAMAAVGLSTNIKTLTKVGLKPLIAGLVLALFAGLLTFTLISLF